MKKVSWLATLVLLVSSLIAQQIHEETTVVNVGVPVRVFQGSSFVGDLRLDDFEVYEDGAAQKLEAVYLVHQAAIERREELSRFTPETSRHFYLFFEISEYTSRIGEALDYFLNNVLLPGDTLTVVTPLKTYKMRMKALEMKIKPDISAQLKGILRQDSLLGNSEYRRTIIELVEVAKALARALMSSPDPLSTVGLNDPSRAIRADYSPEELLLQYAGALANLESFRKLDFERLTQFASLLKNEEGQKYVFVFYQREFLPQIEPRILYPYLELNQDRPDIQYTVMSLFDFYKRYNTFDISKVTQAYADASIAIHFLFISEPVRHEPGLKFQEKSEDIYVALKEMALATGGFFDTSANPKALLKNAVHSSENYYLLYYSPKRTERDGQFRRITVKVKNKDYRIIHRQGYIAN